MTTVTLAAHARQGLISEAHCIQSIHCCFSENPVTIPDVREEEAAVPSTNHQFDDERLDRLEDTLELQYGQVGQFTARR